MPAAPSVEEGIEAILRSVSIALLHKLSKAELPVAVSTGEEVDSVRMLSLAGHVRAAIPAPIRTLSGYDQPPALVFAITPQGRRILNRFPMPAQRLAH